VKSEVCSNELSIVTENTVPTIVDDGFESKTGRPQILVVSNSVDIPDNIDVGVDIPLNKTCDELFKCYNITEVSEPEVDRGKTATRKIKRKKVAKCKASPHETEPNVWVQAMYKYGTVMCGKFLESSSLPVKTVTFCPLVSTA